MTQVARAVGLQGRFDEALALLESLEATQPEVAVRVLLERGRVVNSSGSPDASRPSFQDALSAASEAGLEHLAIDALHMLAIVAPTEDRDGLNGRALELAAAADDPRARQWRASLLNNMGWTAFDRGDYDEALERFEAGLAARKEQGRPAEILVARWCVARCLRAMGRIDEALAIQIELADAHHSAGTSDAYVDEEIALLQQQTTPDPGSG